VLVDVGGVVCAELLVETIVTAAAASAMTATSPAIQYNRLLSVISSSSSCPSHDSFNCRLAAADEVTVNSR
jgi:hypothetical protein